MHHDILDVIRNIKDLYENNSNLAVLKDVERVLDELDLYVYKNWEDGELAYGPRVERHWITVGFMWPESDMPDPVGAKRLTDLGCKVTYQKTHLMVPRKIYTPDDFRPGTKKGKIDAQPIWLVRIVIPKKLMQDIFQGQKRQQSEYVKDHIDVDPDQSINPDSAAQEPLPDDPVSDNTQI
jgi:hypothetical protein